MAYPVYSAQLVLRSSLSGGPTVVFTAPAGFVTVFRTIAATAGNNLPTAYWALSEVATGARLADAEHSDGTSDFETDVLNGHWTFNAAEEVAFETGGSTWDLMISGYLLTLP